MSRLLEGAHPSRVLLLTTGMDVGGAEQQVLIGAQVLAHRGWEVRIVSMAKVGPLGLEAQRRGIPVVGLDMPRGVADPRGFLRLVRQARAWKPDVLHSHMVHANLMARLLRPLLQVPVVISTIHNINDGGVIRLLGYRLTDRFADLTTIVSEAAAERFVRVGAVPRDRLRVIPNAVDTERFRPCCEARSRLRAELGLRNRFVWLAVGRFAPAKDYPNMLTAFAEVLRARPDAELVLVGGGPLQGEVHALVRSGGLGEHVRLLGIRRDVPEVMAAADGYVLSSAWEGMPTVLLEAASVGLPVVATAVGGNHEVVLDGQTGFLVPARDSAALAAAMARLMDHTKQEREAMGTRGRQLVESRYGLAPMIDSWEGLYRELLSRNGAIVRPTAQKGALPSGGQR